MLRVNKNFLTTKRHSTFKEFKEFNYSLSSKAMFYLSFYVLKP